MKEGEGVLAKDHVKPRGGGANFKIFYFETSPKIRSWVNQFCSPLKQRANLSRTIPTKAFLGFVSGILCAAFLLKFGKKAAW